MATAKKIRDRWGYDVNTGARGLEIGIRTVKNGQVRIGNVWWSAIPGRGSLSNYEGKAVEVSVHDSFSTTYTARDPVTLQTVARLCVAEEVG
jgi:hypothetical protein